MSTELLRVFYSPPQTDMVSILSETEAVVANNIANHLIRFADPMSLTPNLNVS